MHVMWMHMVDFLFVKVCYWYEASSAIFVMRPSPRALYFIQTKQQCFKCFIVFYTTDV